MLLGMVFRSVREPCIKAFLDLPPLAATRSWPEEIAGMRVSLMRALQGVLNATLHQFGRDGPFLYYSIGSRLLQPAMAETLIRHGWVIVGQPHWEPAVVQYRLSEEGLVLKRDLESWWTAMTPGQRMRALMLE